MLVGEQGREDADEDAGGAQGHDGAAGPEQRPQGLGRVVGGGHTRAPQPLRGVTTRGGGGDAEWCRCRVHAGRGRTPGASLLQEHHLADEVHVGRAEHVEVDAAGQIPRIERDLILVGARFGARCTEVLAGRGELQIQRVGRVDQHRVAGRLVLDDLLFLHLFFFEACEVEGAAEAAQRPECEFPQLLVAGDEDEEADTGAGQAGEGDAGRVDGICGPDTARALQEFQRNLSLPDDGLLGRDTVEAIGRLRRRIS